MRNYGSQVKYQNEVQGYNSRLDPIQAAFLRAKLTVLDEWNRRRKEVARRYRDGLAGLPGLTLPPIPEQADPVWHLFVIRHARRDALQHALTENGIGTVIHYPVPPHLSGAYRMSRWKEGTFPITEEMAHTVLSLPIGPHLARLDQERVIAVVRAFCEPRLKTISKPSEPAAAAKGERPWLARGAAGLWKPPIGTGTVVTAQTAGTRENGLSLRREDHVRDDLAHPTITETL